MHRKDARVVFFVVFFVVFATNGWFGWWMWLFIPWVIFMMSKRHGYDGHAWGWDCGPDQMSEKPKRKAKNDDAPYFDGLDEPRRV